MLRTLLQQETRHPGTVDKVILVQQIQTLLHQGISLPMDILTWYTGTLDRWRKSLRAPRPLADVLPSDRHRIRTLINNVK